MGVEGAACVHGGRARDRRLHAVVYMHRCEVSVTRQGARHDAGDFRRIGIGLAARHAPGEQAIAIVQEK